MIYTVTFNPAIDYVVSMGELIPGTVNRSSSEQMFVGGKGINVSAVLKELGTDSVALGFTAGFTGRAVEEGVARQGIISDFIRLPKGSTRINVKIRSAEETEINCQGPDIGRESLEELFGKLDKLEKGDTVILAGSIPSSLPSDIYEQILARLSPRGVRAVVDASKDLLLNVLKYKPFLVKPNDHELGEMFGVKLTTDSEIESYARRLREMGAQNVLVSMAARGAVLIDETGALHRCGVCKGEVKNSVGAGDSMVAGFMAGLSRGYDYALKLGTAAGGATAFSDGLAEREKIEELMKQLG